MCDYVYISFILTGLSCNTTEFECENGKCIANSLVCNVDFDCYDSPEPPDRSDESNCKLKCFVIQILANTFNKNK